MCSGSRVLSQSEFLRRSIDVFGNRYDYSKSEYVGRFKKLTITCRVHGDFEITPGSHWNGSGCAKCGFIRKGRSKRKSTKKFIDQANLIHNFEYDYSKTVYRGAKEKVIITCRVHGDFEQTPSNHLQGFKCKLCSVYSLSVDECIENAEKVHIGKYRYDFVRDNWVNMSEKAPIQCKHHGIFYQSFSNHLAGKGCPKCSDSYGERAVRIFLEKECIEYSQQHRFYDCKDKRALPFDFFLSGLMACIEFHGDQHFRATKKFGGEKALKARQKRDQIKRDYCQKNGIPLLEIRYDDPDPEATLREFLNQHSDRKFADPQLKLFPV